MLPLRLMYDIAFLWQRPPDSSLIKWLDFTVFFFSRAKPLVLYVYATDQGVHDEFKARTSSGSLVFNECMLQLSGK